MMTIKLSSSRKTDKLDAFFAAFDDQTLQNPFGKGRVIGGDKALIELVAGFAPDSVVLKEIRTLNARGTGQGSLALDWLCALADEHGVSLVLTAKRIGAAGGRLDHGGLSTAQLKKWYVRHGFSARAGGGMLQRQPKGASA